MNNVKINVFVDAKRNLYGYDYYGKKEVSSLIGLTREDLVSEVVNLLQCEEEGVHVTTETPVLYDLDLQYV